MESKLQSLAGAFGAADFTPVTPAQGDAALLNGPQLSQSASSQDDIDALFGDLAAE